MHSLLKINQSYIEAWNNKGLALLAINRSAESNEAFVKVRALKIGQNFKLEIFLAFLIIYTICSLYGYRICSRHKAFNSSIMLLANLLGFIAFGWILSGSFSLTLFGLYMTIGLGILFLTGAIWALFYSLTVLWRPLASNVLKDFEKSHDVLSRSIRIASLIAIVIYPIFAGVGYFRYSVPSEYISLQILRASLFVIVLSGLLISLPVLYGVLVSKNIDMDMRNIVFLFQSGYLFICSLFLAFISWSFGFTSTDFGIRILVMFSISFLTFAFLLPYFSGWQRSKRWREYLLGKQWDMLNELLNILEFPTFKSHAVKLKIFLDKIKMEEDRFRKAEGFAESEGRENDDALEAPSIGKEATLFAFDLDSGRNDPKYRYIAFMEELKDKVIEGLSEIEAIEEHVESSGAKIAEGYASAYRMRRDELEAAIEKERQAKPLLWIILASILSAILGQVLGNFGGSVTSTIGHVGNFTTTLSQVSILR